MACGIDGRAAGDAQLGARALGDAARAAALGELEPPLQRPARVGAAVGAPQRGAEVGQRAGVLEPRGRAPRARRPPRAAGAIDASPPSTSAGARSATPEPARGAPAPRPLEVLARQRARLVALAERGERERGVRAPARRERVGAAPELVVAAERDAGRAAASRVRPCARRSSAARLRAGSCSPCRAGRRRRRARARSARSASSTSPSSISASISRASANGVPEADLVRRQQLERRAGVGLGADDRAAPQRHPAAVQDHERLRRDRGARPRVGEHLLEAGVGEVERVRRRAGRRRAGRACRRRRAPARRSRRSPASARSMSPAASRSDSLARARSKARLASTSRSPGVAPGRSRVALQALARRARGPRGCPAARRPSGRPRAAAPARGRARRAPSIAAPIASTARSASPDHVSAPASRRTAVATSCGSCT